MKYLITRIEYVTGDIRDAHKEEIETDNIELTRKELHQATNADRVLFVYTQLQ